MSDKFNFTDQEFLDVINLILKLDASMIDEFTPITSMDAKLNVSTLDSLGIIVLFVWISSLFGIDKPLVEDFVHKDNLTVKTIKQFVMANATQSYSYADAAEYTKTCF